MKSQIELLRLNLDELRKRADKLLELEHYWTAVGETTWERDNFFMDLPAKFDLSVLAQIDGKVVGYLIGSEVKPGVGKINKILTHGDHRGCGIAGELWRAFLNNCRDKGFNKLEYRVLDDNSDAIRFYEYKGNLFHGETLGTDGRRRLDIHYIFNASERIPHSRPTLKEDDLAAANAVLSEKHLSEGRRTDELVAVMCNYTGKKYGVATNSASSALFLSLRALRTQGNEVILPSYLCGSVLHEVENSLSRPVFADIDRDFNISFNDVQNKVTHSTKAIIVPHMFGKTAQDLEKIVQLGIPVIEDCAQAFGARYMGSNIGSTGALSVFSFFPTKMLSSAGGGVLLTDDYDVYLAAKDMTVNDNRPKWGEAYSVRMNDLSSAIALSQFNKLGQFVARRRQLAEMYDKFLKNMDGITIPESKPGDIDFRYVIMHDEAAQIITSLNNRNIDARKPVYSPLHRYHQISDSEFPNTALAYARAISLPIYPSMTDEQVIEVAGAVLNWRAER